MVRARRPRAEVPAPDGVVALRRSPMLERATGNNFGVTEAAFGLVAGFVLTLLAVSLYDAITHQSDQTTGYGQDVVGLLALWTGFIGAVVVATRSRTTRRTGPGGEVTTGPLEVRGTGSVVADYGLRISLWPDLPLGIVVGVAAQYLLTWLSELLLSPVVSHVDTRLGQPAQNLTGSSTGGSLALIAVLVCVGSPLVEELFFRGLLLRGLLGRFQTLGPRLAPALAIVISGLVFALAHFEAVQFLGLAAFGMVLGYLAYRTGRLGAGIAAHMTFNTVAILAIVFSR